MVLGAGFPQPGLWGLHLSLHRAVGAMERKQEGTLQRVRGVATNLQMSGDRMEMHRTSEMINKVTTLSVRGTVGPQ